MKHARGKILYIFDQSDWESRMPVAEKAKADGYEVVIALIGTESADRSAPESFKTEFLSVPDGQIKGRNLPAITKQIRRIIKAERPDMVHTVTLKYAFITGLTVLPFRKLRKVYTLAGLGYLFRSGDAKPRMLRAVLSPLLKAILRAPHAHLIFQNPDDLALMIRLGFADSTRSTLIRGSGVNLEKFTAAPEPQSDLPLVLMPTRLVHEKGVHVFIEAARLLKAGGINARFEIAGGETKHNPKAISREEMLHMTNDGAVQWLGRVENMPELLQSAAIVVYPSYYGEGIPRVLLESCAAGKPIITTDHPGCREAVNENENGLLVPVRDIKATAEAIKTLLERADVRAEMGKASRSKAEKEFEIGLIAVKTLEVYKTALQN